MTGAPASAIHGTARRRPRLRRRELMLLTVVAVALLVGWASLASTTAGRPTFGDPTALFAFFVLVGVAHLALTLTGRRTDQILLPAAALLMGISLLLMVRLPQDTVTAKVGSLQLGLAQLQLLWIGLALVVAVVIAIGLRNDIWLRTYKYTWAAGGIAMLALVFLFGEDTNGARLTLRLGPFAGQPSELLKIVLVVFVAAYLADDRALLSGRDTRIGPLRLPPLAYLLPLLGMWGLALAIVVVQRDLGAALLFYVVFLLLLWVATQRRRDLVLRRLLDAGIEAGVHYPQPIHLQGALRALGHGPGDFPCAERAAAEVLSLPIFPHIRAEQQRRVVDELRRAIA